jgi:hypothetical protein
MKRITALTVFLLAGITALAQTATLPTNLYAAGASYNNGATQPIAGTALYARLTSSDAGTYAFTALDILPISKKPFTVSTNISAGVAQKVFSFNGVNFFTPVSAGLTVTGSNTGWNWTSGVLADYNIKKAGKATQYHILPNVRWIKSSVSNGSDYQLIAGVLFGWGQ